jgi:hypothetical protein
MSDRAIEFVETWVSDHIAEGAQPGDGAARAKTLAAQCLTDAAAEGISSIEIKETFDDLAAFIAGEIEEANTREADRRADE